MTNLTPSIQVSEETLARMGEAAENALMSEQDWVEAGRAAYLAMRSKDHSIAVDDVERLAEKCAQACMSEAFPSTATFETRIGKVLRAALVRSKPIDAAQLIANCGFEKLSRPIADDVRESKNG